jgi:hypothetical protein
MKIWALVAVALLCLTLQASCNTEGTSPLDGEGGSSGSNGTGGVGGCKYSHYFSAGCSASPTCFNGTGGACYTLACGCNGTVVAGCQDEFAEPYAYRLPASSDAGDSVGMTCDPTADAGP